MNKHSAGAHYAKTTQIMLCTLFGIPHLVHAEPQSEPPPAVIDEVLVSAQKRGEERLQDVPAEGLPYLGPKWLAQLGHARNVESRMQREPLLKEHLPSLFPVFGSSKEETQQYLRLVSQCLTAIRTLIERKALFRIAYKACRQIYPIT